MAPDQTNDATLVARISSGDKNAMGPLYARHAARLHAVAFRILHRRADAEDVVHDVFLSLLGNAAAYAAARGTVAAWLLVLTRNRAIDRVRAQARRAVRSKRLVEGSGAVDGESIGQRAAMMRRVEHALSRVGEGQRRLLRLAYVEGLSLPEIAARERTRLGTVKSRSSRALAALRSAVEVQFRPPKVGIGPVVGNADGAVDGRAAGAAARGTGGLAVTVGADDDPGEAAA